MHTLMVAVTNTSWPFCDRFSDYSVFLLAILPYEKTRLDARHRIYCTQKAETRLSWSV